MMRFFYAGMYIGAVVGFILTLIAQKFLSYRKRKQAIKENRVTVGFIMTYEKLSELKAIASKLRCSVGEVFNTSCDLTFWAVDTLDKDQLIARVDPEENTYRTFETDTLRKYRIAPTAGTPSGKLVRLK